MSEADLKERTEQETMEVMILGDAYRVRCPLGEGKALQRTVAALDSRLRHIRDAGKVKGKKHVLVMAALNLCHELLNVNVKRTASIDNMTSRLHDIERRIESALADDLHAVVE